MWPGLVALGLPLLEIVLLVRVGSAVGGFNVLAWIVLSALLGMAVLRTRRMELLQRLQAELGAGQLPGHGVVEDLLALGAGFALLVPGLITDALGVLLLVRPLRVLVARWLRPRFAAGGRGGVFFSAAGLGGARPPGAPGGLRPGGTSAGPDGVPIRDVDVEVAQRPPRRAGAELAAPDAELRDDADER